MTQNGMGATPPLSGILPTPEAIKSAALSMVTAMKNASAADIAAMRESVREAMPDADPRLGHPSMLSLIDNMRMQNERDAALAMRNETMAALTDMRTALDRAETELSSLRTRLAERDASVLKAARHRV